MATEIGFIKGLIGSAIATAADGSQRTLQIGDKLFANEIVSTGAAGAVEIEFIDGSIMDLGRNSQAILDNEVIDPQLATLAQTPVLDDVEALQQALLDGADPTQVGEATAAGAGTQVAGNEGHTPVTVEYLAPQAEVTSGFDTTGPSIVFPEIISEIYEENLNDQLVDQPIVIDGSPVAVDDGIPGTLGESNTVFEDRADFNSPEGTGSGFVNGRGDFTQQTTSGNILANDSFGANGPGGLVSVTYTGISTGVTSTVVGGVTTLEMTDPDSPNTGPIWTLTVEPNGEYTFTLLKPYIHSGEGEDVAQEQFQYTIQDADGDTAFATLTFNIVDDVPHINDSQQIPTAYVDEDDINGSGNADVANGDDNGSSFVTLPINFGADGSAANSAVILSAAGIVDQNGNPLTSNGVGLTYIWNTETNTLTGAANGITVLTMTVEHNSGNDSYGVQVNLLGNIDHPISSTEDNLVINIGYTATDFDGDSVNGAFAVDIDDDMPTIDKSSSISLVETDVDNNGFDVKNVTSTLGDINAGADGKTVTSMSLSATVDFNNLESHGEEVTASQSGNVITGALADGTVVFTMTYQENGEYTFTQNRPLDHQNNDTLIKLGFKYTVTDGDGDTASSILIVSITDDVPVITSQPIQSQLLLQESFEDVAANQNGWGVQGWGVKGEGGGSTSLVGDHGAIWTVNVAGIEIQSGSIGGSTASDGNQHAELDTQNFQDNGAGDTTLTVLSTTVNLPYSEASLSFDFKPRPDDKAGSDMKVTLGEGDSAITVILDAQANGTVNITADNGVTVSQVTNPANGWITITLNYGGLVAGATTLSFAGLPDADGGANTLGAYIDNINMTASLVLQVDESNLNIDATADFSGYFTSSFGADGAGSIAYSMNVADGPTGISDTATGQAILLTVNETTGAIEGRTETSNDLVFTVSVDATGNVTLDQQRAVVHRDPANHDDVVSLSPSLINLVATITDTDGDTASAQLDLTSVISFRDDGPSITATHPTVPAYEFTITNHDEVSSASFHNSYGYYIKDAVTGEPTNGVIVWDDVHDKNTVPVTVTGYTQDQVGFFIIPNGENKNSDLEDNTPVTFKLVNGQWQAFSGGTSIVGSGANVYFDNADLNSNSQDQLDNNAFAGNQNWEDLRLPGGDKDFNDVNVNVEWNVINGTATLLTVDETALADGDVATTASATMALAGSFAINAGADGLGSIIYALGLVSQDVDSGLVDTASNESVLLRTNTTGDIEGYVAGGVGLVFTLTVNATTGEVTLTQLRAVVHGNPADNDESVTPATITDGLIGMTATVTDGDGDTASDSIDVGALIIFEDDGPIALADNAVTTEDTAVVISVLTNDTVGADSATISGHTQAANGTVVLNDNGTFTYTPSANYSGSDTFSYTLKDGDGDSSTTTVSIGISPVADAPTLIMSVGEPTTIVSVGEPTTIIGNVNFIINGSFEDISGVNTNGGTVDNQPIADGGLVSRLSIPGWELIDGPAMEPHNQNHAGVGATDGTNYMDLGASPGNSSIQQTIDSLVSGQTYQLSFDFRDKAAMQESGQAGQNSGVMNVLWNGAVVATIEGNNTEAWNSQTINVTAAGSNKLVFAEVGDSEDNWGIAIDNVQLFGVTEENGQSETSYSYDLSIVTAVTDVDGSESLSGLTLTGLPIGVTIMETPNQDGTYNVGSLTLVSDHELSGVEVNAILGSVTATDGSDTATIESNVKVAVNHIDFSALSLVSWGGSVQDRATSGASTVTENALTLAGNSWKAVSLAQLGVAGDFDWSHGSLTFETKVTAGGELQGILFDNNLRNDSAIDQPNLIKVAGSQSWGTNAEFTSEDLGNGWARVEVDLSKLDQSNGVFNNLVFVNDDDNNDPAGNGEGSISFRNLTISDAAIDSDISTDNLIKGTDGNDVLIGHSGDDILIGGAGNDILTGGTGSDIFLWNQEDIGTAVTPSHDIVTDFDVDHDQLNLSDLLSDPSIPHTIEGIATGADNHLQLNINDASGNTVQQIELQGVDATHFGADANATLQSLIASGAINDGI